MDEDSTGGQKGERARAGCNGGTARKERRVRCVAGGERGEKKNEEAMGKGPMYYSQPPLWAPTEPSGVQGADIAQMGADGVITL